MEETKNDNKIINDDEQKNLDDLKAKFSAIPKSEPITIKEEKRGRKAGSKNKKSDEEPDIPIPQLPEPLLNEFKKGLGGILSHPADSLLNYYRVTNSKDLEIYEKVWTLTEKEKSDLAVWSNLLVHIWLPYFMKHQKLIITIFAIFTIGQIYGGRYMLARKLINDKYKKPDIKPKEVKKK